MSYSPERIAKAREDHKTIALIAAQLLSGRASTPSTPEIVFAVRVARNIFNLSMEAFKPGELG